MHNQNIFFLINILWSHIKPERKKLFFFYIILTIITAFAEIFTLGSIVPFLSIFINPSAVLDNEKLYFIINYFNILTPEQLFLPVSIIFIFFVSVSSLLRIYLLKFTVDISVICGSDLSIKLYDKTLNRSYLSHVNTNSSEIISGISQKLNDVINSVLWTFMNLLSSLLISILIIIFLIYLKPIIALVCFLVFGSFYFFITYISYKKLIRNSKKIAKEQTQVVKSLQEGLGNIRDVLLDSTQKIYTDLYKKSDLPLRKSLGNNQLISLLPKYIIESFALVSLALIALLFSYNNSNFVTQIPILGALALGAQKLLPSFQLIYFSYTRILGTKSELADVLNLLKDKNIDKKFNNIENITFKKDIIFNNICYQYNNQSKLVLNQLNFKINKESVFGIYGSSGSGKSTLIDILAGLLNPISGQIIIDDAKFEYLNYKSWQSKISYVPQNIFLSETSFLENIAIGIPQKDIIYEKVIEASKKAQIYDFIQTRQNKFDNIISERGFDISGGQRQRIAIARALYRNSEILILDEFTSSLDIETEKKIMNMINNLKNKMTVILVSHKKSTLEYCDDLILIESGKII